MPNLNEEKAVLKRLSSHRVKILNYNFLQKFLRRHSIDAELKQIDTLIEMQTKIVNGLKQISELNNKIGEIERELRDIGTPFPDIIYRVRALRLRCEMLEITLEERNIEEDDEIPKI